MLRNTGCKQNRCLCPYNVHIAGHGRTTLAKNALFDGTARDSTGNLMNKEAFCCSAAKDHAAAPKILAQDARHTDARFKGH